MKSWLKEKWNKFKAWVAALLISLGLAVPFVIAEDNSLTWNPATTYTDGTAIQAGDLSETRIYYASGAIGDPDITDPAKYQVLGSVAPDVTTYEDVNRGNGLHCYYVTHVTVNGIESDPSNFACKTVDFRAPNAPEGLQVN